MKTSNLLSEKWRLSLVLFTFLFFGGIIQVKAFEPDERYYVVKVVDTEGNPIVGAKLCWGFIPGLDAETYGLFMGGIPFDALAYEVGMEVADEGEDITDDLGQIYYENEWDWDYSKRIGDTFSIYKCCWTCDADGYYPGAGFNDKEYNDWDYYESEDWWGPTLIITLERNPSDPYWETPNPYPWDDNGMEGYVTDDDGIAIPQAKVSVWGYNANAKVARVNAIAPREGATLIASTTTDENGYYFIQYDEQLFSAYSNFCITIEAEGYETRTYEAEEITDNNFTLENDNSVGDGAGIVDGIAQVKIGATKGKHYSVSGVEISPNAKGIHIVNGKKVIVR